MVSLANSPASPQKTLAGRSLNDMHNPRVRGADEAGSSFTAEETKTMAAYKDLLRLSTGSRVILSRAQRLRMAEHLKLLHKAKQRAARSETKTTRFNPPSTSPLRKPGVSPALPSPTFSSTMKCLSPNTSARKQQSEAYTPGRNLARQPQCRSSQNKRTRTGLSPALRAMEVASEVTTRHTRPRYGNAPVFNMAPPLVLGKPQNRGPHVDSAVLPSNSPSDNMEGQKNTTSDLFRQYGCFLETNRANSANEGEYNSSNESSDESDEELPVLPGVTSLTYADDLDDEYDVSETSFTAAVDSIFQGEPTDEGLAGNSAPQFKPKSQQTLVTARSLSIGSIARRTSIEVTDTGDEELGEVPFIFRQTSDEMNYEEEQDRTMSWESVISPMIAPQDTLSRIPSCSDLNEFNLG